jgi:hypothetical protein
MFGLYDEASGQEFGGSVLSTVEETSPWIGFWQVVYEDADDEIVPYPPLRTTVSLRRSGFSLYTQSNYIEMRAAANRRPPAGWPATPAEKRGWFETSHVSYGACTWTEAHDGWTVAHRPAAAAGGEAAPENERRATLESHRATVGGERWRRLSGPGASPLVGGWEQTGPTERWMYLTCAGHYAVVREVLNLEHDDIGRIGANAGARVESARSFDHWPFITSGGVGSMDARKHETFRVTAVDPDRFTAGFAPDGSDAVGWQRID